MVDVALHLFQFWAELVSMVFFRDERVDTFCRYESRAEEASRKWTRLAPNGLAHWSS